MVKKDITRLLLADPFIGKGQGLIGFGVIRLINQKVIHIEDYLTGDLKLCVHNPEKDNYEEIKKGCHNIEGIYFITEGIFQGKKYERRAYLKDINHVFLIKRRF